MTNELPILDQAVLAELRESVAGDEVFLRELAAAYIAEAPSYVEAMAAAAAADDAEAIVRPAHSLKSSSAALGAARLSAMCREIEHGGREGRVAAPDDVEAMRSTWEATIDALKAAGIAG